MNVPGHGAARDGALVALHLAGASGDRSIALLDARTGAIRWTQPSEGEPVAPPRLTERAVVLTVLSPGSQSIVARGIDDGAVQWAHSPSGSLHRIRVDEAAGLIAYRDTQ